MTNSDTFFSMNAKMPVFYFISGVLLFLTACGQKIYMGEQVAVRENDSLRVELTKVWETEREILKTPECATYDAERNIFYVSNLNRDNETDNDGFISLVNVDGSVKTERWVEGLTSPFGNYFYNDHLFVNDGGNIIKINIETGRIIEKIAVEGASSLNGIDIDEAGNIYAADSRGNKIFKVSQQGEVTLLYEGEDLKGPNGVSMKGNELIIASFSGTSLLSLNLKNNQIRTLVEDIGRVDGIIQLEDGHFITSSWSGEVYFISNDLKKQKILDTSGEKINAADIGYIPEENLLVIPTFYDNRLMAYKVTIHKD
ncbi:MAG: hypothetical protein ABJ092_11645 [Gillisia sp.]